MRSARLRETMGSGVTGRKPKAVGAVEATSGFIATGGAHAQDLLKVDKVRTKPVYAQVKGTQAGHV